MTKRRYLFTIAVAISFVLLIAACSNSKNIPTRFFEDYKATVMENSSVTDVSLLYSRPSLQIYVRVPNAIGEEEMAQILELTKSFVTIEKMNEIEGYINQGSTIRDVYLAIMNNEDSTSLRVYETGYYKGYETDKSSENIDGYKTWSDSEIVWKD